MSMFKPVDGRNPYGVPVGAYRNLATKDTARQWSFRALDGPDKGRKVAEGDSATLTGCSAYVRSSTRDRIVAAHNAPGDAKGAKGHREVHAWIVGVLVADGVVPVPPGARRIAYNPYRSGEFHDADTGAAWTGANAVTVDIDGRAYEVSVHAVNRVP